MVLKAISKCFIFTSNITKIIKVIFYDDYNNPKTFHFAQSMSDKEFIRKLGKNISSIRKSKGIKQIDLAYACDFEKQNMQRIEAGKTNPTIKTLLKIAEALEVTVIDLLKF